MGSELVSDLLPLAGGASSDVAPSLAYTAIFYENFPFYLSIGMTYEQYWEGDCCLVKYYRKAYELQRDRENQKLWLQGLYIYEALCDVSPILRAFAKKGTKPVKYTNEPYAITQQEIEKRRKEKEKAAYEKGKAKLSSFAIRFNANIAKRKEVKENG